MPHMPHATRSTAAQGAAADTDTMVASVKAYVTALNKLFAKREKKAPEAISA